jgi:predicted dehydrogenase
MGSSLRLLVLGCGSIGQRHIKNLKALQAGEILAFDLVEERRNFVQAALQIETVDELEAAWTWKPNVVLIASSTETHVPLALQAVEHGCHLFIEKPLSYTFTEIERLCVEVEQRQLTTMVGCNLRFHPGPATVKRLIAEKAIGEVISARIQTGSYLPQWRPNQDYRQSYSASIEWGGATLDCIHEIDLALWYLGPAVLLAAAALPADSIDLKTDGLIEILLQHTSGALSSVHLNFVQRDYRRACQIIGSEGSLYWDFSDHQVRVFGAGGELQTTYREPANWEVNQMYLDEMAYFLQTLSNQGACMNPVSEALETLHIALAARQMGLRK